jgi:hypothetical protein
MEAKLQIIKNSEPEPVSENQIIKSALKSTLVKSAVAYEIDGAVSVAIDKAIFYLGLKTPNEDRDMIKITVIDDAKRHFTNLTIAEIGIAIENGSKGLYGEVKGLAPKDAFNWLTAYSISQLRKDQVAELAKQNEATPEPTDEQKAQMAWNNLLKAWACFKEQGSYNDFGNAVYKTLVDNGKINFSDEQKADFYRLAKADLMKQYNPVQYVGNVVKMNECKSIIAEIINGGDENTRVKVNAKKLALNHFFVELKEMDIEIADLFE